MTPTVIIIGADKGGVGKTTVTRALLSYLAIKRASMKVFDTEHPKGDLLRFDRDADIIDIEKTSGQMRVFDGATRAGITVVDLRAGLLSPTIEALDAAQLLADVRDGVLNLVILHVLGPSVASIDEVSAIAARIGGGAKHLLVKNHINATEWTIDTTNFLDGYRKIMVDVPKLDEVACETVQRLGGAFNDFVLDKDNSRTLRGLVRTWLGHVWSEFDRVGVARLLDLAEPERAEAAAAQKSG